MFSRDDLDQTMVTSVLLDLESDSAEIRFLVPTDRGELEYSAKLDWTGTEPSSQVKSLATALVAALVGEIRQPLPTTPPCLTCSSVCCRAFDSVRVTEDDLRRLESVPSLALSDTVIPWDEGATLEDTVEDSDLNVSMDGTVGYLKKGGIEGSCVLLQDGWCSVYDHRPDACRRFSAHDCGLYELDPSKVRLKLLSDQG